MVSPDAFAYFAGKVEFDRMGGIPREYLVKTLLDIGKRHERPEFFEAVAEAVIYGANNRDRRVLDIFFENGRGK